MIGRINDAAETVANEKKLLGAIPIWHFCEVPNSLTSVRSSWLSASPHGSL